MLAYESPHPTKLSNRNYHRFYVSSFFSQASEERQFGWKSFAPPGLAIQFICLVIQIFDAWRQAFQGLIKRLAA